MKHLIKTLLVLSAAFFLGSCATSHGVPVGTVIESHEDCFVKTKKEFVRIECPPGYVEPWFYEDSFPAMTDEEKAVTLGLFRDAQMTEEELVALKGSIGDIVNCSPEERSKSMCRQKMYSDPQFLEVWDIISKQRGWVNEGVNKVIIKYRNVNVYPKRSLSRYAQTVYDEELIDIVLTDFIGADYKKYSADLGYVFAVATIAVYVESDIELEKLLTDPRITSVEHVGDVRELEEIVEEVR